MGEIADGLINGDFDFFSGEYLGEGGGFPRSNHGDLDTHRTPRGHNPLKGVRNYLQKRGILKKGDQRKLMEDYIGNNSLSNQELGEWISDDWDDFIKYCKKHI